MLLAGEEMGCCYWFGLGQGVSEARLKMRGEKKRKEMSRGWRFGPSLLELEELLSKFSFIENAIEFKVVLCFENAFEKDLVD